MAPIHPLEYTKSPKIAANQYFPVTLHCQSTDIPIDTRARIKTCIQTSITVQPGDPIANGFSDFDEPACNHNLAFR